jgi:hypothetical protein
LRDWRLCPDCGKFIDAAEQGADSAVDGVGASDADSELSF